MKKFWRITFRVIGLIVLSTLLWLASFLSIIRTGDPIPGLELSPSTTVVTEPLNAAGYPVYCQALNARLSAGVSPEENFWTLFDETMDLSKLQEYQAALVKLPGFGRAGTTTLSKLKSESIIEPTDLGGLWEPGYEPTWQRPWHSEQHPEFAEWIRENEAVLSKVIEAADRPKSYAPAVELEPDQPLIGVLLPHAQHARLVTRILCARAMLATHERRFDDAWRDVLTCQRITGHVWQCGSVMETLVGVAIGATSGNLVTQLLPLEAPDQTALIKRWKELTEVMSSDPRLDRVVMFDRMMNAQMQFILRTGREDEVLGSGWGKSEGLWSSFQSKLNESAYQTILNKWDINASLKYATDRFDEAGQMFALPTYRQRLEAWTQFNARSEGDLQAERKAAMSAYVRGNNAPLVEFWRTYATRNFMPAYGQVDAAVTRHAQRRVLHHAAFVAELHRRKTGHPPRDGLELQQVARQYAADADVICPDLIDLYTEEPLRLRHDGQRLIIYACGQNFVDEDGAASEDATTGDIPVMIELR